MARNRIIKPEFWLDDEIAKNMDAWGRLFYIGLWNHVEDSGIIPWNSARLKVMIFPWDDDITEAHLDYYINQLIQLGKIIPYEANGKAYLWLKRFLDHQKIDKPSRSKYPLPPWLKETVGKKKVTIEVLGDLVPDHSPNTPRMVDEYSPNTPGALAPKEKEKENENVNEKEKENVNANNSGSSKERAAAAAENPGAVIVAALQRAGILAPSSFEIETLLAWYDDGMELDAILLAIKKAALSGNRRLNYIQGILRGWANNGITTLAQAQAADLEFQKKKNNITGIARAPTEQNPAKPQKTEEELYMEALIREVEGG